jgi:CDP-glycerol glycerophosphotransferase (TagB/SpsB family)
VHVNHGESDKVCMVSNQVKAYDRVFIAGEAARRRHRAALMEFDDAKLVPVGRPQLDLRPAPVLAPSTQRTVLYAPTWEGENASNNYTSVDVFGQAIVEKALAVPNVRVVYKPHPRVAVSPLPAIAAAHREIVRRLSRGEGHVVQEQGDILAVFPACDVMITDVSSVGLDFLYLRPRQPMFIADRYADRERLQTDAPISRCADVIDTVTIDSLTETLTARLDHDEYRQARAAVRELYFGDLAPGESTTRFLAAIDDAVRTRDSYLSASPVEVPA